jgi:predicted house-cleaning NTP pyrophosphatase (Maf/HAM1 superfamily)
MSLTVKSLQLSESPPVDIVITADTVVSINKKTIFGKPANKAEAI